MAKVELLPDDLINKIAAGEVVERPAAVVKELVENAIDAGADRIDIEVERGGKRLMRIVDNGSGMNREDALMALQRHATSKLRTQDDLFNITTMGFRGEAVPSIASVSRFMMQTCCEGETVGTQIFVEGGAPPQVTDAGRSVGTTIEISDLFFNVPARRKFMKTDGTEFSHIAEAITRLAMAHPHIRFKLTHNRRVQLQATGTTQLKERVGALLGRQVGQSLYPVEFSMGWLKLRGLFSRPDVTTQGTKGIYLFANGRFIRHRGLAHACQEAYRGTIEKGRFPYIIMFIDIDPAELDVNVHPQKTEVRFQRESEVYNRMLTTLRNALARSPWVELPVKRPTAPNLAETAQQSPRTQAQSHVHTPSSNNQTEVPTTTPQAAPGTVTVAPTTQRSTQPTQNASKPVGVATDTNSDPSNTQNQAPTATAPTNFQEFRERFLRAAQKQHRLSPSAHTPTAPEQVPAPAPQPAGQRDLDLSAPRYQAPNTHSNGSTENSSTDRAHALSMTSTEKRGFFSSLRYIGQFTQMYLIFESSNHLILLDQHAAHERVNYQRLLRAYESSSIPQQRYLIPPRLELGLVEAQQAEQHQEKLEKLGIELEPFGGQSFALKAVPSILKDADPRVLVSDVLEELATGKRTATLDQRRDEVLMRMACHGSVRGAQRLGEKEVQALLHQLDQIDFKANCPHGRPVYFEMPRDEIEKRFHRT